MSISDGQKANATNTNSALMSRTSDTDTSGKLDLLNSDSASGSTVSNVQRELNSLASFIGKALETAKDDLPAWAQDIVGSSGDNVFQRVDALVNLFLSGSGHSHDGTEGQGAPISASNLSDFNKYFTVYQKVNVASTGTGSSTTVTTEFSGKSAGGGVSTKGVLTSAPDNRCMIRLALDGTRVETTSGEEVYGRITESSGVWTLSYYYTDDAGTEQTYSFGTSEDIDVIFREVFDQSDRPTIPADLSQFAGTLDITQDVIDASSSQRGLVSTVDQTFGGDKRFAASISTQKEDVATTATPITALSSAKSFVRFTGSTATEIQGISSGGDGQHLTIHNGSTANLTIKNEDAGATASDRITSTDGSDITVEPKESAEFIYDSGSSRWVVKSGVGGGASTDTVDLKEQTSNPATPASGFRKLYTDDEGYLFLKDDAGIDADVRLFTVRNYITNGDFRNDTAFTTPSGWTVYRNTVDGDAPDDFGGTPAAGFTFEAENDPSYSLTPYFARLSKGGTNQQGHGVYTGFTVSSAGGVMTFDGIMLAGGTLAKNDIKIYLVSSNDSFSVDFNVISPSRLRIDNRTGKFFVEFKLDATDTDYRLCLHYAGTGTTATASFFSDLKFGPGYNRPLDQDEINGHIELPKDKTYVLDQSARHPYTIHRLVSQLGAGTCTLDVNINGSPVTGLSSISATTSEDDSEATGANGVSIGDKVTLVVSATSSSEDLSFSMEITK